MALGSTARAPIRAISDCAALERLVCGNAPPPLSLAPKMTFREELERTAWAVEQRLGQFLATNETTPPGGAALAEAMRYAALGGCLLYTSDAADDLTRVGL